MSPSEACFWFSTNNLITIGFGNLVPGTRLAGVVTSLEHFAGILLSSILLGLVVAKGAHLWCAEPRGHIINRVQGLGCLSSRLLFQGL